MSISSPLALRHTLFTRALHVSVPALARVLRNNFHNHSLFSTCVHDHSGLIPRKGDRVIVAMSGGVDSSVTAKLLADQDYDLSAVFMRNWDTRDELGSDVGCEWEKDWEDVQQVCRLLDIPCRMVDLSREYWTRVFEPSLRAWEAGITPNPDVWCNREVKFGALFEHLSSQSNSGISCEGWLATGHYARKSWSVPPSFPSSSSASLPAPRPLLLRAADHTKDQTYYLASVPEPALARAFFPLSALSKPAVRALAHAHALPTARRAESMGLCFVGERKRFHEFLGQYIAPTPGPVIDLTTGRTLGTHEGLWTYTIGQSVRLGGLREKMYVAQKDAVQNAVFVVPGEHDALFCTHIQTTGWRWIWADMPPAAVSTGGGLRARMQFRHVMRDVGCTVRRGGIRNTDGEVVIELDERQSAVAPGQIAVVWEEERCLGCGIIESAW